ncbi:Hypothetical predicted protein [Pelobates cultripes]|uniref:Uncharacterized protein n=1 Tax=Pelobates cultripes TaxID=61616 RepID=A0AAD1VII2_PELCU|nr:Hypothetical predicted protein [Pelobates cultripes]
MKTRQVVSAWNPAQYTEQLLGQRTQPQHINTFHPFCGCRKAVLRLLSVSDRRYPGVRLRRSHVLDSARRLSPPSEILYFHPPPDLHFRSRCNCSRGVGVGLPSHAVRRPEHPLPRDRMVGWGRGRPVTILTTLVPSMAGTCAVALTGTQL